MNGGYLLTHQILSILALAVNQSYIISGELRHQQLPHACTYYFNFLLLEQSLILKCPYIFNSALFFSLFFFFLFENSFSTKFTVFAKPFFFLHLWVLFLVLVVVHLMLVFIIVSLYFCFYSIYKLCGGLRIFDHFIICGLVVLFFFYFSF